MYDIFYDLLVPLIVVCSVIGTFFLMLEILANKAKKDYEKYLKQRQIERQMKLEQLENEFILPEETLKRIQ